MLIVLNILTFFSVDILLISSLLIAASADKLKHPQEIDFSGLEDDDLFRWSERRNSKLDCVTFYRRIVKHLFNEKRFQLDPRSSNYYVASIPLRLNKEQFELLVKNNIDSLNMNEVDDLLAEVLKKSNDEDWDYPVAQILFDHYKHQLIESLPSLHSPVVLVVIAVLSIVVMNRTCSFSKLTFSAITLIVFLIICAISYGIAYRDCLSDLEVEQMIQLSKKSSGNNPCKDYDGEYESIWSSIRATVLGSSENKCLEHMRKVLKRPEKYCDPLEVGAKWFGKIQMTYFGSIIGGFLALIANLTSSSNLLTTIIFWVVSTAVFIFFFLNFGKSAIKHGFRGMFNVITTTKIIPPSNDEGSSRSYDQLHSKMDEILQENRHMKRELSAIREMSVERSLPNQSETSPPKLKKLKHISESPEAEET